MQVPVPLSEAFGPEFEERLYHFVRENRLINDDLPQGLGSIRFLRRSILPHVEKLSQLFNRLEDQEQKGVDLYWKQSSNPKNLRLAYFLYFMPANLYRTAGVISELSRLGYRFPHETLKAIDLGAGPASAATGVAAGNHFASINLPDAGSWSLVEQDKGALMLGHDWARNYFDSLGKLNWGTKPFHPQN